MEQARHIRLRALHSWAGISFGLFIFIVVFTGSFAVFHHEIRLWEDDAWSTPLTQDSVAIDPIVKQWVRENIDTSTISHVEINHPTSLAPYYSALIQPKGGSEPIKARWNSQTGEKEDVRAAYISDWFLNFHRQLMWPRQLGGEDIGRTVVSLAGVVLLLSLLSGIITHRKLLKEAFTLRLDRSFRLHLTDAHKVIGLWGLPFYTISAFTGAFLGLTILIAPIIVALSFKGDITAASDAYSTPKVKATGVPAQMLPLDDFFNVHHPEKQTTPFRIVITNWGDENALYDVYFPTAPDLTLDERLLFKANTAEILPNPPSTAASAVTYAMAPLHFGNYAGPWGKALYAVMGLSLAGLIALGLSMWLEHRPHYKTVRKVAIGTTMGLVLATLTLFFARRALPSSHDGFGVFFFAIWGAILLFSLLHSTPQKALKQLGAGAVVLLCASPILLWL